MGGSSSSSSSSTSCCGNLLFLCAAILQVQLLQLPILLTTSTSDARQIMEMMKNEKGKHQVGVVMKREKEEEILRIYGEEEKQESADLNVFFTAGDLYKGKKMPVYFGADNPSTSTPRLLPRQEAESIPFSSSKLPQLLDLFGFSEGSPQAKAMERTLKQCELEEAMEGEIKFCATSLEAMLDLTHAVLGGKLKVMTTNINITHTHTLLQEFTFMEEPLEIAVKLMLACHKMAYPYAVYYCHGHKTRNRLFKIPLRADNGDTVQSLAICHMDTSLWDPHHPAFRVLRVYPGTSSVCHFLPPDTLVWLALAHS